MNSSFCFIIHISKGTHDYGKMERVPEALMFFANNSSPHCSLYRFIYEDTEFSSLVMSVHFKKYPQLISDILITSTTYSILKTDIVKITRFYSNSTGTVGAINSIVDVSL